MEKSQASDTCTAKGSAKASMLKQRTINKFKQPVGDIAEEWDALLVSKATELLNGSVDKHAHWFALEKCVDWVQEQCGITPSGSVDKHAHEALTTLLSGIHSWLQVRSYSGRELRKKSLRATTEGDKRRDLRNYNATHKRASA